MIVNQFSTFPYGGAGTAAVRHHNELRIQGIDSRFYYRPGLELLSQDHSLQPASFEPKAAPDGFWARQKEKRRRRKIIRQFERHLVLRPTTCELFSQAESIEPTRLNSSRTWGDIVHLHWMSFLIDFPSFFASLPQQVPIVWTLHDMNPFTGGCHYSGGCTRFATGCGHCPSLVHSAAHDLSHDTMRMKRQALEGRTIHVVSPSRWINKLAQRSPVWPTNTQFHVINYGLDVHRFRPIAKNMARKRLGLPQNSTLIAFGAEDVESPRKGFHLLLHALRKLPPDLGIECVVFGRGRIPENREGLPIIHELGFVEKPESQAMIYSAADIYVMPSLEDNAPQTGLEAMACGTPVVAFEAGGIPEFVMPGQTGLLASVGNVAELASQIRDLTEHGRLRQRLAAGSRKLIESEYDIRKQVRKYIELYSMITGRLAATRQRQAA